MPLPLTGKMYWWRGGLEVVLPLLAPQAGASQSWAALVAALGAPCTSVHTYCLLRTFSEEPDNVALVSPTPVRFQEEERLSLFCWPEPRLA